MNFPVLVVQYTAACYLIYDMFSLTASDEPDQHPFMLGMALLVAGAACVLYDLGVSNGFERLWNSRRPQEAAIPEKTPQVGSGTCL